MPRWFRTAAALLLAAFVAAPAFAQTLTGSITGTIKDQQGAVLPGVTVTLTGKMGAQTQVTDANGVYRFPALEPGAYEVAAELSGFQAAKQGDLQITPGRTLTIDLALRVGGVAENVKPAVKRGGHAPGASYPPPAARMRRSTVDSASPGS